MRVHPISCGFGFAFLVEAPHGLFLVDSGSPGAQEKVLAKMRQIGRDDLRLIWITHAHYDHYGSAAALREHTGAPVGVHPADAGYMAGGQSPLGTLRQYGLVFGLALSVLSRLRPLPATEPDFTLEDGATLECFGLEATILHTPGHTPGHTCVLLANRVGFAGDLIGRARGARLQHLAATDWSRLPGSLKHYQAARPEKTYTGHSPRPISAAILQQLDTGI